MTYRFQRAADFILSIKNPSSFLVILRIKAFIVANKKQHTDSVPAKDALSVPEITNSKAIEQFKKNRKKQPTSAELIEGILNGNITALSRAISLVESTNADHLAQANTIINACLPHANQSVRIGITGIPGVGKSTFIEAFGKYLTGLGKKVAVLAIDPSSTISHGSILGDKTRMEELSKDPNAYIRPSASGETLGGVARKTRETITLCEACGFDTILIETVGVGQSETAVHSMVDFFLLLKIVGAGDELQGMKRGIMEMADAIVINKADGDNIQKADFAKKECQQALHLFPVKKSDWIPIAVTCSALTHEGIPEIWQTILQYVEQTKATGYFFEKRKEQNQYWLSATINEQLQSHFYSDPEMQQLLDSTKKAVQNDEISPFAAAQMVLKDYFKNRC